MKYIFRLPQSCDKFHMKRHYRVLLSVPGDLSRLMYMRHHTLQHQQEYVIFPVLYNAHLSFLYSYFYYTNIRSPMQVFFTVKTEAIKN